MTIKPVGNQKASEKKDNHPHGGHVQVVGEQSNQNVVRSNHRNVVIDGHGQSPQRRGDVFDEITRHRRSPHKSGIRSKRDKRDREREKISASAANNSPQYHQTRSNCGSPHSYPTAGGKSPEHVTSPPVVQNQPATVQQAAGTLLNIIEETYSGYNSGDEHFRPKQSTEAPEDWKSRDEEFKKIMSDRGFVLKDIEEDGACLFRAISQQIYGDEEMHDVIRQQTMDYIQKNKEYFSQFVTEDINAYIKRKRKKDSHGNHIEVQAMSEIYNRPVELYSYKSTPINIFNSEQLNNGCAPLRLSYQRGSHYNAILDPYNATVGVGLGLAGYKPELQTRDASILSENLEIEQTMLEDKLKTTDWEATNEVMEEQIARESYLQWCRDNMQRDRDTTTSASSSTIASGSCSSTSSAAASSSATVTSAEAAQNILRNARSCTVTTPNSSSTSTSATCAAVAASSGGTMEHSMPSVNKDGDGESGNYCDSDDTDMSTTSSNDHQMGEKRFKKMKSGKGGCKSSRRRKLPETGTSGIDTKIENETKIEHKRSKPTPPHQSACDDFEIGPPASKSPRRTNTPPIEQQAEIKATETKETQAFTNTAPGTSKQAEPAEEVSPVSKFYQSLLESSYADDGFGQLSESEMLQQALRMSTIDFFDEQKRKYSFN